MIALFLAPATSISSTNLFHFLIGFLLIVCVIAIVIISIQWLAGLAKITIPPPLLAILGIILFMGLLIWLANYTEIYRF